MKSLSACSMAVIFIAAFLFTSCMKPRPRYEIGMVNMTPHDFEGVAVYYGGTMAAEMGHLVRGGIATYGIVTLPVPDEAEVRWVDRGVSHAPKVKVGSDIRSKADGSTVYFIIHENGSVTVKAVSLDDIEGDVEATKGVEKYRANQ